MELAAKDSMASKSKVFTIMSCVREFADPWDRAMNSTGDKGVGSNNKEADNRNRCRHRSTAEVEKALGRICLCRRKGHSSLLMGKN